MSSRNAVLAGLVVGGLALCVCAAAIIVAAASFFYVQSVENNQITEPLSPEQVATGMEAIEQWVTDQRGLQPNAPVDRKFMNEEEVRQRTLDDFNEDTTPEEWDDSERVLAAIGLLPKDYDLYTTLLRLYSEGVVGFYDPDTKELVVVSEQGGLNAYERVTFAHEYNHVLQDQNYDVRGMGFSDEGFETDPERGAAVQALLEGDATLLEEQYLDTFSQAEQREYDRILDSFDLSLYSELPVYLLNDFIFPYDQGLDFVRRFYDEGGWARVDEVWRNPPASTEHILHPERYEAGEAPIVVARPALTGTLGAGWRHMESSVMGEWYTFMILAYGAHPAARLSESVARPAAEGWGGDSYSAFYNAGSDEVVLALHWVWDTAADAGEFVSAFRDYADGRFGAAQVDGNNTCWAAGELHCFYVQGEHTLWLVAPDQETTNAVLSLYPDFE